MASSPLVEYQFTLVPKGETISSASERRMEQIVDEYDKAYTNLSKAKQALRKNKCIDKYALRKYWDVVRLDVQFANEPWNSLGDLEDDIMVLDDDIVYVESSMEDGIHSLFISTVDGEAERLASKITDYYELLNPIVETGHITVCPDAPLLEIENQFRE